MAAHDETLTSTGAGPWGSHANTGSVIRTVFGESTARARPQLRGPGRMPVPGVPGFTPGGLMRQLGLGCTGVTEVADSGDDDVRGVRRRHANVDDRHFGIGLLHDRIRPEAPCAHSGGWWWGDAWADTGIQWPPDLEHARVWP